MMDMIIIGRPPRENAVGEEIKAFEERDKEKGKFSQKNECAHIYWVAPLIGTIIAVLICML
jgi:glycerol uptake facilitator-like aquaporin